MTGWAHAKAEWARVMTEWVRVRGFRDFEARRCLRVMAYPDTIQNLVSNMLKTRLPCRMPSWRRVIIRLTDP